MPNVIGVFENKPEAEAAIERLTKAGIDRAKINLFASTNGNSKRKKSRQESKGGTTPNPGGVKGTLNTIGVPSEDAKLFERHVNQGMVLVAIQAQSEDEADRAVDIMEVQGATDVEGRNDDQGNVEAAPEYEGARQSDREPKAWDDRNIVPAEQPISDFSDGEWSLDRQDEETNGEASRSRVYRPMNKRVERSGPLPDEFHRR